jgi:small subunit ribosomal protein S7
MARGKRAKRRILPKDPIYKSQLVTKLINRVMKDGKKTIAQKHVYKAFEEIKKKTKKDPLEIFYQALENVKPSMEVRPRRVGGACYQVPMPVKGPRRESLAIRWLVLAARSRPNKEYHEYWQKLAAEILDAYNNTGGAVAQKQQVERMAEANKAFAHFRW